MDCRYVPAAHEIQHGSSEIINTVEIGNSWRCIATALDRMRFLTPPSIDIGNLYDVHDRLKHFRSFAGVTAQETYTQRCFDVAPIQRDIPTLLVQLR